MTETVKTIICLLIIMTMPFTGYSMVICHGHGNHQAFEPVMHNHCDHISFSGHIEHHTDNSISDVPCSPCEDMFVIHELIKPVKYSSIIATLSPLSNFTYTCLQNNVIFSIPENTQVYKFHLPLNSIVLLS